MSITILPDSRYRVRVRGYGSERGEALTFNAGTPLEIVEAEHARRVASRDSAKVASIRPTVAVLSDDYLATRAKKFSPSGLVRATGIVREIQRDPIGAVAADDLKSWHFDDWQERLDDQGDSDGTIDRKSNVLRSIIRNAVRRGKIETSPLRLGDLPRRVPSNRTVPVFFTPEQWTAFIGAMDDDRNWTDRQSDADRAYRCRLQEWRPIWWTLLLTGCRLSEILNLTWDRVDMREGVIRIAQPKTGFDKPAYISAELREVLETLPRGIGRTPLFARMPSGTLRKPVEAQRAFAAYRDMAGLPRVLTCHKLRHTTASWAIQSGASLKSVQEMLGHRSSSTTERYAHLGSEHVRAAVATVGKMAHGGGE